MIPGARLIILGRQGAGKGTQCVRLSRHSSGRTSRPATCSAARSVKAPARAEAQEIMDSGGLVGDDIMVGLVEDRLDRDDALTRGYILDGFPRTVFQAQSLDGITAERPITMVIDLDVPREIVLERISACWVPVTAAPTTPARAPSVRRGSARSAVAT